MKKLYITAIAVVLNMSLFSCTNDTATENDALYEQQATEGDDGDTDSNPDSED